MWLPCALALGLTGTIDGYRLENGLTVVLEPLPRASTVTVVLGIRAGAGDEPPGRRGLAHFVEHLVFRRAGRLGPFAGTRFVEQVGGTFNGMTMVDRTVYLATTPPEHLETLLFLERERLAFSAAPLTQNDLDKEREVVARELELREGLALRVHRAVMAAHLPAGHPAVRSKDEKAEVKRHSLEEVRWFLDRYYRPDEAVLTIAGRFEPDRARALVDRWLASVPRPPPASPAPASPAPELRGKSRIRVKTGARVERLERVWVLPPVPAAELDVARAVLQRELVGLRKKAPDQIDRVLVGAWRSRRFFSQFEVEVVGRASKKLAAHEASLDEAIRELALHLEARVVEGDVARCRLGAELAARRAYDQSLARALLSTHRVLDGEAPGVEAYLAALRAVTREQVIEVLRQVLATRPIAVAHVYEKGSFDVEVIDG